MAIHINDNGEPDLCRVDVSNPRSTGCPFGDSDTHFESMEQAREYYEGWSTPVYDRYAIGDSRVLERLLDNGVLSNKGEIGRQLKKKLISAEISETKGKIVSLSVLEMETIRKDLQAILADSKRRSVTEKYARGAIRAFDIHIFAAKRDLALRVKGVDHLKVSEFALNIPNDEFTLQEAVINNTLSDEHRSDLARMSEYERNLYHQYMIEGSSHSEATHLALLLPELLSHTSDGEFSYDVWRADVVKYGSLEAARRHTQNW